MKTYRTTRYRRAQEQKKRKKKIETSKVLLIISDGCAIVAGIAAVVSVFITKDTSPFAYLIPATFGLSATSHGFYYWKAKAENLQKFGRSDEIKGDMTNDENII